jgi:hypothetical protein
MALQRRSWTVRSEYTTVHERRHNPPSMALKEPGGTCHIVAGSFPIREGLLARGLPHSPDSPFQVQRTKPSSLPHSSLALVIQMPNSRNNFWLSSWVSFIRYTLVRKLGTTWEQNPPKTVLNGDARRR